MIRCLSPYQVWARLKAMSSETATSVYTVWGLSAFYETVMSLVTRVIERGTAMSANIRTTVKRWSFLRLRTLARERGQRLTYLLYGSSPQESTASRNHAKAVEISVKKLA